MNVQKIQNQVANRKENLQTTRLSLPRIRQMHVRNM